MVRKNQKHRIEELEQEIFKLKNVKKSKKIKELEYGTKALESVIYTMMVNQGLETSEFKLLSKANMKIEIKENNVKIEVKRVRQKNKK